MRWKTGSEENVRFVGAASGELTWVSRLAGVLAGDVRQYFIRHGQRIWPRMDASGLRGNVDPYSVPELSNTLMPIVATINERLADPEPEIGSEDTVMLQGYYKAFLEDRSDGDRLISFGDPDGHLGILRITRGDLWHIRQLPD